MLTLFKIILGIFLIFTALGLLCAVRIGRRRPPAADPYFYPFGEMQGFTREQLETIARRPVELHHQSTLERTANPSGQDSGVVIPFLSRDAAVSLSYGASQRSPHWSPFDVR